ncbi:hypothetical protein PGT21_030147 [Puccinia graminis f. sp. tritici]|uniref:Uncharacterized protein n=1 Tax=Puccinia graminis f. sp. tritici TaxID=56615 RepID=A0A5B0Q7N9_PUCGR|nr:hypothetical protein PGT21_030147 [Puccinia graminis f. sp. tritici]
MKRGDASKIIACQISTLKAPPFEVVYNIDSRLVLSTVYLSRRSHRLPETGRGQATVDCHVFFFTTYLITTLNE